MRTRLRQKKRQKLRPIPEGKSDSNSESDSFSSGHHRLSSNDLRQQCFTRVQEKEELQELNDRLFQYIDHIQNSSFGPNALNGDLDQIIKSIKKQTSDLSLLYTDELNTLRNQLDEMALRLADCQIQLSSCQSNHDAVSKQLQDTEIREAQAIDRIAVLTAKLVRLENDLSGVQQLKKDRDELVTQTSVLQKQLEAETLLRTDLQNRLITTTEKIAFLERLLREERETVNSGELHVQLQAAADQARQYRRKLKEALDSWRMEPAGQLEQMKQRLEKLFQSELAAHQSRLLVVESQAKELSGEVDRLRSLLATREAELSGCRVELQQLTRRRGSDPGGTGDDERTAREQLWLAERDQLLALLEVKNREHMDLLGIKVQLDTELAMYRKLLEAEEYRCNLSPLSANLTGRPVVSRRQSWITSTKRTAETATTTDTNSAMEMSTVDLDETESTAPPPPPYPSAGVGPISLRPSAVGVATPVTRCCRPAVGHWNAALWTSETSTSASSSAMRVTCSSEGPVYFSSVDSVCGIFSIHNANDQSADLTGWQLHYAPATDSGSGGEASAGLLYTFPARQLLPAHSELWVSVCRPDGQQLDRALTVYRRGQDGSGHPPPSLFVVTDLPVWSWCQSVLALQNSAGTVQALCELEPVSAQCQPSRQLDDLERD